jgi:hypothetical protein
MPARVLKSPCSFEIRTSHSKIEFFTFSAEMGRPSHPATKYDKPFRLIVFLLLSSLVYSKRYILCLRSMLTLRVLSWILQAHNLLWRRHLLRVFLGAVALRTRIRFCKLTLQAINEEQSRFLMRKFLIRHFRFVQSTYSYADLPSRSTSISCKIGSR